jgi:hypothetical protein
MGVSFSFVKFMTLKISKILQKLAKLVEFTLGKKIPNKQKLLGKKKNHSANHNPGLELHFFFGV